MSLNLAPGVFIRNPDRPEWGLGQVQSAVGDRVTVNFENAGKLSISAKSVPLVLAEAGSSRAAVSDSAARTDKSLPDNTPRLSRLR